MEQDHSTQLLMWLDEEHRKDKAMQNEILAQLDQHLTQIVGVTRGLQDLEERLARVQSQSLRYSQIEQALGQVKTEVTLLFEQFNQRVQQREEENFKVRQLERERFDKAVVELNAKIDNVEQLTHRTDGLGEGYKRIEAGQIAFVRGLEDVSKRLETTAARVSVTEEWVKRTGALIAEVQQLSDRLRQDRSDTLEAMRRADQMRARQITEWNEQMKVTRREMEDWIAQLKPLLDVPKETRSYLASLKELENSLKQVEPRLMQRQKLTEEFSRKEIEAIKAEAEKRTAQMSKDWDFMKEEWSKKITSIVGRFDPIDEWRPAVMEEFHQLREKMEADRQRFFNTLIEVVRTQLEYGRALNTRYDQFASDMITMVETAAAGTKVKKPRKPVEE